ncbi:hypothetical protein BC834DRAFT_971817 [Gloeopeniophorella convolvens]|nr:hypothetical protein BC834DRAFT_971817 [Gloeopeniophorella convolvens]
MAALTPSRADTVSNWRAVPRVIESPDGYTPSDMVAVASSSYPVLTQSRTGVPPYAFSQCRSATPYREPYERNPVSAALRACAVCHRFGTNCIMLFPLIWRACPNTLHTSMLSILQPFLQPWLPYPCLLLLLRPLLLLCPRLLQPTPLEELQVCSQAFRKF